MIPNYKETFPPKEPTIFQEDISLIFLASLFRTKNSGPPLPLRRTFSLAREIGFKSIFCEPTFWPDHACNEDNCGQRFTSCKQYVECLKKYYNTTLKSKECYKFVFFRSQIKERADLSLVSARDLIGFCFLHRDTFQGPDREIWQAAYVTESIINIRSTNVDVFSFGQSESRIVVDGNEFNLTGNYFSQQNNITNCCAHAAIKMAIRGYYPNTTAELINACAGIDHTHLKGNIGLDPDGFTKVIREISQQKADYFDARSFETPFHFLKFVYHAIESRFPVILLFTYPLAEKDKFPKKQGYHAATLIGHTFNKHTWWANAWKGYFAPRGDKSRYYQYLPSLMWCNNFVIQDDNLGPYYLLPLHSLKISDLSSILTPRSRALINELKILLSKKYPWMYRPLYCVVTYPKKIPSFNLIMEAEPYALKRLRQYLKQLFKEEKKEKNKYHNNKQVKGLPNNMYFTKYLLPYCEENSLILRTFVINKKDYVSNFASYYRTETIISLDDYIKSLNHILPDFIWLTEISVPELFWINEMKLGDIIIDPHIFEKRRFGGGHAAVIFMKLPGLMTFLKSEKIRRFYTNERESRYPLISPDSNLCFK